MELKDKIVLSQISTDMWVKFSDSAEYRKKLDGEYSDLLKIKNRLKKIDCKTANDFKLISDLISSIDNFYDIGTFSTWEDYERFAGDLDTLHTQLEKQIEKEEINN